MSPPWHAFIGISVLLLPLVSGNLEPVFKQCSSLGSNWATEELVCNKFPAPVAGVAPEQQSICLAAVEIACLNKHREQQCEIGKGAARTGVDCLVAVTTGGEYRKDCCEACKLGLISGSMGMGCTFQNFAFGSPWDKAYKDCCDATMPSTTSPALENTSKGTVIPTPALDSLCDLLPGELCAHICVPIPGSFKCLCREGFTLMADGKSCQQEDLTDRCKLNNPCSQKCTDTGIAIECSCHEGFSLAVDERSCIDIDECELGVHFCNMETHECHNQPGGFSCSPKIETDTQPVDEKEDAGKCPVGYQYNAKSYTCDDVNECLQKSVCGGNTACQNTIGSYTCVRKPVESCPAGYKFDEHLQSCSDIDECSIGVDTCEEGTFCVNTVGNYTCLPRKDSQCPAGYKYNKVLATCEDVDECTENLHSCIPGVETCRNTVGAYECDITCDIGYQYSLAHRMCIDIDECQLSSSKCEGKCINTIGSFVCQGKITSPCPAGFKLKAQTNSNSENLCEDVNECTEGIDSCDRRTEICVNEMGSYRCEEESSLKKCNPGYSYHSEREACLDINECLVDQHNCSLKDGEECINIPGSFMCKLDPGCPKGYFFNKTTLKCEDIDECEDRHASCQQGALCVNTIGSFICFSRVSPPSGRTVQEVPTTTDIPRACPAGFRFNLLHGRCFDVNECEEGTHVCSPLTEECLNEPGGYRCGKRNVTETSPCQSGFQLNPVTHACNDIDECAENMKPACDSNQECRNTIGSFNCICKRGFELDPLLQACVDLNECQVNMHDCLPSQRCDNTIGSFQCIRFTGCGTGYTLNAQTGLCEDDNECILGTDNCRSLGPAYQCRNTLGSFRCERKRCEDKQILLSSGECKQMECSPGYEAGHGQCMDINECERNSPCRRNQRCLNVPGSYRCLNLLNCPGGYEANEVGTQCLDIDECTRGTHDCKRGQQCINSKGGYICQCPPGHTPNQNKECVDVDECTRFAGQICAVNSVCHNTVGSYRCICKDGFRQDPKGGNNCIDIDECSESPGLCQQNCVNMWGSYRCSCNQGFTLQADNRTCQDIDECEEFKDRNLCVGICVNEMGSYSCRCPDGYRLGTNGHTCQDIDECLGGNVCQGPNEVCLNTRGGYRCNAIKCPPRFVKDLEHKNRCKRENLYCQDGDTECIKLPASYSFNFITFVSKLSIPPLGYIDLFTMRGPLWSSTNVRFKLEMLDARAPIGISRASRDFFQLRRMAANQAVISLVRSVEGPQEIELQLSMELYHNGVFGGAAVAKLFIFVSQYEF